MTRKRAAVVAALLITFALARIAATFRIFSNTVDEAVHVSVGLHLLTLHRMGIQYENPPLVPMVLAAPLLAFGHIDFPLDGNYFTMTHAVFYSARDYKSTLFLARVGNLLFFAIAALATWLWARREIGERAALIALLVFTMEPIVLGYSGLATHDAGAMAGVAVSMLSLSRWLERRSWLRAIEMGAAFAFATLCKFSCIPFVAVAWIAVLSIRMVRERSTRGVITLAAVPLTAAFVLWAGYGFSFGATSWIFGGASLPAPSFWRGIVGIIDINRKGMAAYAFGQISNTGWWWYFPVAIVLKTTLPLLALVIAGAITKRGPAMEATFAGLAILAVGMTAHLDLGVRYMLPVYVCWVLPAAAFAEGARVRQVLIAAQIIVSLASHPDYFPYFNVIAGREPSRYLCDSNLDWGQDALRLRSIVRREKITQLAASLFGSHDLDALGLPKRFEIHPEYPTAGWIAISEQVYTIARAQGGLAWMAERKYRRIGKSIRLYHID